MRKHKLLILLIAFCSLHVMAQQELSLHFMQELAQSKRLNPAVENPYKLQFGLVSPAFNYASSAFSLNDIFITDKDTWFLNLDTTLNTLKPFDNRIQFNSDVETISFGIQVGKIQFSFFHRLNLDVGVTYPKILPEYLWYGNANYVGELIDIAPEVDIISYHEFGFGASANVSPKLRIGGHLKYLQGILAMDTDFAALNFYTDPEFYQLTVASDLNFFTSGVSPEFYRSDSEDIFPSSTAVTILFNNNRGLALDVGANYQLNEKVSLAFSALDLGMIVWQSSVYKHRSKGLYTFEGFDVNPFRSDAEISFEEVLDTLRNELDFTTKQEGFTSHLRPKFYLSGEYQVHEDFKIGALFYGDVYGGSFNPAFGVSLRQQLGKVHIGTLLNLRQGSQFNIGLNGSVKLGPVQLFAVTNSITNLFSIKNGRNTSLRLGLNLVFKQIDKEKIPEESVKVEENGEGEKKDKMPDFINPWNN